ncbi:rubrerythrin family protein [Thermodesulfobacteriota bacterium]
MDELRNALHKAYTGEAKAALRLKLFAEKAERDGYPQVAKLFRVIAFSEEIHGTRCLKVLKEVKSTEENLADSFESETKVAEVAYNDFIKLANSQGDKAAEQFLSQSRDVEETHAKLYKEAMNHLMEERETTYHVCKVCGYVSDGVLPDECPVCAAGKEQFTQFA